MEQEILKKIEEQSAKIEEIGHDIHRMKQYFFWTFIITISMIVLPIVGLMFIIPQFLSVYSGLPQ